MVRQRTVSSTEEPEPEEEEIEEESEESTESTFEYNNHAELAYLKYYKKAKTKEARNMWQVPPDLNKWERRFIEEVNHDKPIRRTVTKVIRTREADMHDNRKVKEFMYYFENWEGVDGLGNPMNMVPDHIEGFYNEVLPINIVNEKNKVIGKKPGRTQTVYYIPWSKSTLDKILEGQERDTIKYMVKSSPTLRTGSFTYDQFANLPFLDCVKLARQTGGPMMTPYVRTV